MAAITMGNCQEQEYSHGNVNKLVQCNRIRWHLYERTTLHRKSRGDETVTLRRTLNIVKLPFWRAALGRECQWSIQHEANDGIEKMRVHSVL